MRNRGERERGTKRGVKSHRCGGLHSSSDSRAIASFPLYFFNRIRVASVSPTRPPGSPGPPSVLWPGGSPAWLRAPAGAEVSAEWVGSLEATPFRPADRSCVKPPKWAVRATTPPPPRLRVHGSQRASPRGLRHGSVTLPSSCPSFPGHATPISPLHLGLRSKVPVPEASGLSLPDQQSYLLQKDVQTGQGWGHVVLEEVKKEISCP